MENHLSKSQLFAWFSVSPKTFIDNLFYILKPGGFLYLAGFIFEGKKQNYSGLHKHDLLVKGEHLYLKKKDMPIDKICLTCRYNLISYYKEVQGSRPGDKFTLIYKKGIN